MKTSARNELKGKITDIIEGAVMVEVKVEVAPTILVSSTVTKEGVNSLGLTKGDEVVNLIKASSIVLSKKEMKTTARNNIKAKIEQIIKGAVNSEIKLSIGKNTLCAVITNESVDELGLNEGDEAYAIFKASSVILVA
jgi:molybdate transport system regulatory protein